MKEIEKLKYFRNDQLGFQQSEALQVFLIRKTRFAFLLIIIAPTWGSQCVCNADASMIWEK